MPSNRGHLLDHLVEVFEATLETLQFCFDDLPSGLQSPPLKSAVHLYP
jgi:hypothetical protein